MDLIAQAVAKREKLRAELQRVDSFLSMAYELQGETNVPPVMTDGEKVAAPIRRHTAKRAASGVGALTAKTAADIIREANRPMSTRELAPLVEAHGVEIGGRDKVATLSARLGNDAKRTGGLLVLEAGKWNLLEWISNADNEETADTPTKEEPAASHLSNEGAPLWNRLNV